MNSHNIPVETSEGETIELSRYSGSVMLIVNTASSCGFTPQFQGLEKLYETYRAKGFVVLGFPCNQFGNQDPGSTNDSVMFCQKNYGVSFPMMAKIDVNGPHAHPLFTYLKSQKKRLLGGAIKWNFTKFLVDQNGEVVERFAPNTEPSDIEPAIQRLLNK